MLLHNVTDEPPFVYGSELQGRGYVTKTDFVVGTTMWAMSFLAVVFGSMNIYIVWKMPIFHNSFGALWMSRTIGEVGANIVHVVYSAPVTILQPESIPPVVGIIAFTAGLFLACEACVLHQIVATNRLVAVCFPMRYKSIFSKRITKCILIYCWTEVAVIMAMYYVLPCSIIGYSPKFYEYIYIKCPDDMARETSMAGTLVNRSCFFLCLFASLTDIVTLTRIVQISLGKKQAHNSKRYQRDVRFFGQTSVQNLIMMISCFFIVIANNGYMKETVSVSILAFDTLILTHLTNSLALLLFNPEVRRFLMSSISSVITSQAQISTTTPNERPTPS